jgi:dihydroorotase
VDIHEHYREPGFTYKETIKTGSEAASRGGFTTVCTMPNVDPVPDDLETFEKQVALNEANSCVHLKQYGAITEDLTSDKVVDMAALKEAGLLPSAMTATASSKPALCMKLCRKLLR